ncbi:GDP-mannose 4,6-dehydratase [Actinoplanes sp. NPDC048796]|uniref:dTDP-glucose 4,6-dehydratase n=1 Tax=Actinoplanes sp. NPDC048796 TaxID=3155640 RepID=UPI003401B7C4
MNVLVTGGAGFVGSHFVRAVLGDRLPGLRGASVTVLDKLVYAGAAFANLNEVTHAKRLDFHPGDAADAALVSLALRGCDTVVNCAYSPGPEHVLATSTLLEAAQYHGIARFVHMSCDSVYGSVAEDALTEATPLSPTSPAAACVAGADLLATAFHRTHGLPVVIVRAATTYGSRQPPTAVLPRAVTALLDGRTAPMCPGRVRDWLHVDDLCRAMALAATAGEPGATYHVGGSVELSERALLELVLAEFGAGWDRVTTEPPSGDLRYALNDDKIREHLDWHPRVEFTSGLAHTIRWYRDNPGWWRPQLY